MQVIMEKKIKKIFTIIGYVATLIGLLLGIYQLISIFFSPKEIPKYTDSIHLSSPQNKTFIDFLEANEEKVVYIKSTVRDDMATPLQARVLEDCENETWTKTPFVDSITYIPVEIDKEIALNKWPPGINCFSLGDDYGLFEDISNLADCKNDEAILYSCPYYGMKIDSSIFLPSSGGGTGVHSYFLTGFFTIKKTYHSGPSVIFNLSEIQASPDLINRVAQ